MHNVPRGAFCNTFDLHLATICHIDLCFVRFWVAVLHRFTVCENIPYVRYLSSPNAKYSIANEIMLEPEKVLFRDNSFKPNICVSWSTSELRVMLAPRNLFSPPVKHFIDPSKVVPFCGSFVLFMFLCCSWFCVCSLLPYGDLLRKGWPLDSYLWCLIVFLSLSHVVSWVRCGTWCINTWSLPPFLLL